jgi:Ca2+-binding EF-hand superfamily protein
MGKQFYKNPSKKEIEEAFRYFDKDKSGEFKFNGLLLSVLINNF